MAAEVMVPTADDKAIGMCWLCAHMVADHGASPEDALKFVHHCACEPQAIYPADVLFRRRRDLRELTLVEGAELMSEIDAAQGRPPQGVPVGVMRPGKRVVVLKDPAASRATRDPRRR